MAATFVRGGTFLPSEDNSPRNATIDCTGADFLVVRLRCFGSDTISGITFNGDALTLDNPSGWVGGSQQYTLTAPDQVSGTLSMSITDGYGRVIGEWEAWSGVTGTGAAFGAFGTSNAPASGSKTVASGSAVSAMVWDNYAPSMTSTAGTAVGTASYEGGSGNRSWGAYRTDTGDLSFSTGSDSSYWEVIGLPITGASAGPVITGPSGGAGASSSTANVAEAATTGPTFSTSIALGSGYPTLTGTDASLWTLTSLTSTSWRVDPNPAKNFESPTDAGANNVHDVVFNASATVSQSCAITITNVNEAPTFTGAISVPTLTQSVAMTPVSFASLFGDPDAGDTATYSEIGTWPAGIAISGTTIAGTPTTVATTTNLRVRRTDALGLTVDSNLFSIQVDAAGAAPTVATQPSNQTADEATTATFTAAFNNSPTAFSWQYADAPYSSWSAVSGGSGAATASYTTAALIAGMNGRRFRCTATNAFGSVVTDGAAQLTVNPVAGAGTITTDPFREWGDTNDWAPGTIIDYVWIERLADAVNVQTLTAQALNPSSRLILSGAGIVSGQDYLVRARLADGSALGYKKYTAA